MLLAHRLLAVVQRVSLGTRQLDELVHLLALGQKVALELDVRARQIGRLPPRRRRVVLTFKALKRSARAPTNVVVLLQTGRMNSPPLTLGAPDKLTLLNVALVAQIALDIAQQTAATDARARAVDALALGRAAQRAGPVAEAGNVARAGASPHDVARVHGLRPKAVRVLHRAAPGITAVHKQPGNPHAIARLSCSVMKKEHKTLRFKQRPNSHCTIWEARP